MLTDPTRVRLRTQLEALDVVLAGVPDERLSRRPPSGKWSALENLAHLGRHHEVMLARLERIAADDAPRLDRYRAEDDPEWPRWQALTAGEVLARLRTLRAGLVAHADGLSDEALARVGVHAAMGRLSMPLWLEFFLLHEAHHLYAVFALVRPAAP